MPAVLEDARLAVDVGDRRAAGGGVGEGRVVAHQAEVVVRDLDLPQVHRPDGPVADLDLVALAGAVVGDAEGVAAGRAVAAIRRPAALPGLCLRRHRTSSIGYPHIFSRWRCRQTNRASRRRLVCSPACRDATTSPARCSASARTHAGAGRWSPRSRAGRAGSRSRRRHRHRHGRRRAGAPLRLLGSSVSTRALRCWPGRRRGSTRTPSSPRTSSWSEGRRSRCRSRTASSTT